MSAESLLPEGLLDIMQCPRDGGELVEDVPASQLVCLSCRYRYNVEDGIPIMLIDEAVPPDSD